MSIRKIAQLGHPILRQPARNLTSKDIKSEEIARLIQDMIETMAEYDGLGLAAPQVHESVRLAIIGFSEDNDRYPNMKNQPLGIYINPKMTVLDPTPQSFWEGCLSVHGLRGLVHRPRKIRVDYLDEKGKEARPRSRGFRGDGLSA